jgi:hypothetical protein
MTPLRGVAELSVGDDRIAAKQCRFGGMKATKMSQTPGYRPLMPPVRDSGCFVHPWANWP